MCRDCSLPRLEGLAVDDSLPRGLLEQHMHQVDRGPVATHLEVTPQFGWLVSQSVNLEVTPQFG